MQVILSYPDAVLTLTPAMGPSMPNQGIEHKQEALASLRMNTILCHFPISLFLGIPTPVSDALTGTVLHRALFCGECC